MTEHREDSTLDTSNILSDTNETGAPFDEESFVREARRKSTRRIVATTATVTVLAAFVAAAGWAAWNRIIDFHSNRISIYQYELVALSTPNTHVTGTGSTLYRFPRALNTYTTYRPVGDRPVPAGEFVVDFSLWGSENSPSQWQVAWKDGRRFTGPLLAPELGFVMPDYASRASEDPEAREYIEYYTQIFDTETGRTARALASASDSATAEVALSFSDFLDLSEMDRLIGADVTLNWGAVDVWEDEERPAWPASGHMVGVAFIWPDGAEGPVAATQLERDTIDKLRFVAQHAPKGTADLSTRSADYLAENGARYYGAVVTGRVDALRRLVEEDGISASVLGFVVEPWQ